MLLLLLLMLLMLLLAMAVLCIYCILVLLLARRNIIFRIVYHFWRPHFFHLFLCHDLMFQPTEILKDDRILLSSDTYIQTILENSDCCLCSAQPMCVCVWINICYRKKLFFYRSKGTQIRTGKTCTSTMQKHQLVTLSSKLQMNWHNVKIWRNFFYLFCFQNARVVNVWKPVV